MPVRLVEVTRANIVESVHYGDVVVVNYDGKILYELGDPNRLTFMRSSAKPIYAVAIFENNIIEKYGLDLKEAALLFSSHSGEKEHIEILNNIMEKTGIELEALQCGVHEPINKEAARELLSAGKEPNRLHCNCSGKHMGYIAAAKSKGIPVENYYKPEHEFQKDILKVLADFSGIEESNIIKGIDGCGMTVHAIPLKNIATAYANLCNEKFMDGKYSKSQNYVLSAMTMYPEMIAGNGRLDTELMKNYGDRVIGKFGNEGVYCLGIVGRSIGMAVKIDDGNSRAVGPVILEALLQMGVLKKEEVEKLREFWNPELLNNKSERIGEIKAVFKMK